MDQLVGECVSRSHVSGCPFYRAGFSVHCICKVFLVRSDFLVRAVIFQLLLVTASSLFCKENALSLSLSGSQCFPTRSLVEGSEKKKRKPFFCGFSRCFRRHGRANPKSICLFPSNDNTPGKTSTLEFGSENQSAFLTFHLVCKIYCTRP